MKPRMEPVGVPPACATPPHMHPRQNSAPPQCRAVAYPRPCLVDAGSCSDVVTQSSSYSSSISSGASQATGRSLLLRGSAGLLLAAAAGVAVPFPASAAAAAFASGRVSAAGGPLDAWLVPSAPEPVTFPRRKLGINFAVLLMRSGYSACDDLNFIPMEEFQVRFWKLRQAEWQPYTVQLTPLTVKQGDLTAPAYFDFISASQWAAAAAAMPGGRQLFEEYCEDCGEGGAESSRTVAREAELQDNALLPAAFERRAGEQLYAGLREGFRGTTFAGVPAPLPPGAPTAAVLAGVEALLGVFVEQGFAIAASVRDVRPAAAAVAGGAGGGVAFTVRLEGPANLWALRMLGARRSGVANAYDALAVGAFLGASGRVWRYSLEVGETAVEERWVVV